MSVKAHIPRTAWRAAMTAWLCAAAVPAHAQPDMSRPAPETIADRGSALYRFENVPLMSSDGTRSYRLRIAIPKRAPGPAGHPVAWLLDGKAALAHIDEALLTELDGATPPVIVAIGHDTPLRLDATERIRDYTPGTDSADPRGRRGGGADDLLDLIEGEMTARLAAAAPIDRSRQTVWGHSLGGLFVLHALLARPAAFSRYYAASPSLWWDDGAIVRGLAARDAAGYLCRCVVVVGDGSGEAEARRAAAPRRFPRSSLTPTDIDGFHEALARLPGVTLRRVTYAGLGHGATLGASLPRALRLAAGLDAGQ